MKAMLESKQEFEQKVLNLPIYIWTDFAPIFIFRILSDFYQKSTEATKSKPKQIKMSLDEFQKNFDSIVRNTAAAKSWLLCMLLEPIYWNEIPLRFPS